MQDVLLPLFPLEIVLMPGGHLPLHIFEERYKEMIGEARRNATEFGIVLVSKNGLADIGCTAVIEGVLQEYPDGRLDILTRGRRRFEILLVNEERNFLRGAVEFFDDESEEVATENLRADSVRGYNALQVLWNNVPLEAEALTDKQMSFRLARAVRDLELRQQVLTCRSEAERMEKLAPYLTELADKLQRAEQVKSAPRPHLNGNGTGKH